MGHDETLELARWLAGRAWPAATWDRLPGSDVQLFVRLALALLKDPPPVLVRQVLADWGPTGKDETAGA